MRCGLGRDLEFRSVTLSVENEVFAALGESLGDHLCVERVGEDLGPILEGAIGRDGGRATIVVAFGDDLKCKLCLRGVHFKAREVVDDQ